MPRREKSGDGRRVTALSHSARAASSLLARITALDFAAFALPAVSFVEIMIVGRLILTEVLLLSLLPWLWRAQARPPFPLWFVILWTGWLLSQIVTDVVVGSAVLDWARGWAGILFTLTNFAAILVLVATPKRARLFAFGLAAGGLLGLLVIPHPNAAADPWKWGIAGPVALVIAAGLSGSGGDRRRWLTITAFLAFGVLNLFLGYRSLGGISLLVAAYLGLTALVAHRRRPAHHRTRRAIAGVVFLAAAGIIVLAMYSVTASQGLLGPEAQARYADQGGALGALLGGRPEALVSTQAIIDSPVLGHGSWAEDSTYAKLLAERQRSLGYEVTPDYVGSDLIPAHSYLLGAWVWGGFLGALFWFAMGVLAVRLLADLYSVRLDLAPLLAFSTMLLLWDIAFSPYGLVARITAPYGVALCLLGLRLMRDEREEDHTSDRVRHSSQPRGTFLLRSPDEHAPHARCRSGVGPSSGNE